MRLRQLFQTALDAIIIWMKEQQEINTATRKELLLLEERIRLIGKSHNDLVELIEARRDAELKKGK